MKSALKGYSKSYTVKIRDQDGVEKQLPSSFTPESKGEEVLVAIKKHLSYDVKEFILVGAVVNESNKEKPISELIKKTTWEGIALTKADYLPGQLTSKFKGGKLTNI